MGRARKQPNPISAGEGTKKGKQRAHDPKNLGSRVYQKEDGGVFYIDERWRGGNRHVLRDPDALGGDNSRNTTRDLKTAESWRNAYDAQWHRQQEEEAQRKTGKFRTLSLGVEKFLAHRKRHTAGSTHSGSRTATAHLIGWFGPGTDPAAVTSDGLQEMFDDFVDEGYEASTLHNVRYHLRMFFDSVKVAPNPAREIDLPPMAEGNVTPWNAKQRSRVRSAADQIDLEHRDSRRTRRLLVECLFSMGLRIQEAAAIQWEDVDAEVSVVRISQQISRETGEPKHTKGRAPRSATILPDWWDLHDEEASGLIVAVDDGKPFPYMTLYKYICEVIERAGLKRPGVAAHQFRHTYSFDFIARGGTLDELSQCLGHKKLSTTQKYYQHFTSDHAAARAAERINRGAGSVRRGPRKKA